MADNQSLRAYRHIRRKFIDGTVEPGARLSYVEIGKEIGISATPVREAVGLLASEGFVELVPQIGARVRKLGRREAIDLYETREALESYAAGKAAERADEHLLAEIAKNLEESAAILEAVTDTESARAFHSYDLAFHMLIIEASQNHHMIKVVGDSHVLTLIFRSNRSCYRRDILERTQVEHEAIYEAIKSGDADTARRLMEAHIHDSLTITLAEFEDDRQPIDRWWE